jgi:UDP-glucuronate 4-epimerase
LNGIGGILIDKWISMYKILITGSAGFIGFHLANYLINKNFKIIGLDSINEYYDVELKINRLRESGFNENKIKYGELQESNIYSNYSFIKLNLEDKDSLFKLFEKHNFDFVINLAAQAGVRYSLINPDAFISSNILGFFNLIEISKTFKIKNFIYASSSSVYGLNKSQPFSTKDNVDHPLSIYAATKKSNELIAHSYSYLHGLPTIGLRFFTVYGPWGRPDMALFNFTKSIYKGEKIELFNYGEMRRDFTYIDDIVEAISILINKIPKHEENNIDVLNPSISTAPYKIYNIGNSAPVKLEDFISLIEKNINRKAIKELKEMPKCEVSSTYADVTDLFELIKFKPSTDIETGVKKFINWYKEYYKIQE